MSSTPAFPRWLWAHFRPALRAWPRRLVGPGQRLLAHLNFASRMALTGFVFSVPIGILLFTSHSANLEMIRIAGRERAGIEQITDRLAALQQRHAVTAADVAAIAEMADRSSLTLDTDLDSYYLMHALTVQLPELLHSLAQARAADERNRVPLLSEQLAGRSDALLRSLDKAGSHNGAVRATLQDTMHMLRQLGAWAGQAPGARPPQQERLALQRYQDAVFAAAPQFAAQLDGLLERRIAGIQAQLWTDRLIVLAALLLVVYLAAAAYFSVMDSVARIVSGAQRIASGDFSSQVDVRSGDEIGLLAQALNQLQSQLHSRLNAEQARLGAQRHLIAGIAHELNTPVGNMRLTASTLAEATGRYQAEVAAGQLSRSGFQQYLRMMAEGSALFERNAERAVQLVDALKHSGIEVGASPAETVAMEALLQSALLPLRPLQERSGAEVVLHCPPGLRLHTNRAALEDMLRHLLRNSLQHGLPAQGQPRIVVEAAVQAQRLVLRYRDNGPGVPHEAIPKLFDPFYTTAQLRGQLGLGLYIVSNLVTHVLGGRVNYLAGQQGFAMQIEVALAGPA
ncbi:sensor histidine kinase [Massilia sp. SM-13]|uniref:sensor histidine kinase n=1 Tax=Pseudoduganella rhizocola TaxID=3382643 RepID=UPI0038B69CEF